ncbi:hypothetical protein QG37_02782 [Candidozyma auris]|uniref:Uncharacterized protein n=1 Tax=Candidozyma auris TaxID=498019 RepID=A0A0L0P2J0_CANAR|nr:hypothetical protein QG37_02782 [[Candida] auris]
MEKNMSDNSRKAIWIKLISEMGTSFTQGFAKTVAAY